MLKGYKVGEQWKMEKNLKYAANKEPLNFP